MTTLNMGDFVQPAYLPLDWNTQQVPAYQSLILASDTPSRNHRKVLSRVSKPSSAGNSPHSHPRRRTMTTTYNGQPRVFPINTDVPPSFQNCSVHLNNGSSRSNAATQRKQARPTSWHPSLRQGGQTYFIPNCHPSWFRDVAVPDYEQQQSGMASMYGLSTPITCPLSGDLLSTNDYFPSQDESYNCLPPGPQAYTPVEPPDMLFSEPSDYSTFSMEGTPLSAYPWMQQHYSNGFVSTDPVVDFGHESVASADDLTAPPTPDPSSQDCMAYTRNNSDPQQIMSRNPTGGDDLVAVGLYDEPESLSFGSSLLGGDFSYPPAGKGLKLEETFTPAPEADDDEDADADADDDQEGEE